ncbi:MAG: division/cell wall cluster transcriptional repressor MraZ [Rhodospirillaceae bacterium]|nr:division/cell wall cluster transcriptional repressor MraZ [Rhodospirillaceae bacterium]
MALLIGRFANKIDGKGRVSVPKSFRDVMMAQASDFAGVYAYPLFKAAAIEFCGEIFMQRLTDSIDEIDMFSDDHDDLASILLESAHSLAFDPEGRVTLPDELIEHAGLQKMALFVGRAKKFHVWNPETYEAQRSQAFERARSRGATLKLRPLQESAQ